MAKAKTNTTINGQDYYRMTRTIDGRRKQFYGTSKHDAERKYKEYLEEYLRDKREKKLNADNALFRDRANEYIQDVLMHSQRYASSTKEKYEEAYRCHIKGSSLDSMRIWDIRPSDVQRFYNNLDVSKQTMQNVNKFMSGFCKWLVRNDYAADFLSAVEMPVKPSNKKSDAVVIWTDDEMKRIVDACRKPQKPFRLAFMPILMIYTGLRIGEALSLCYSDFSNSILTVNSQYTHGEVKVPKYGSSRSIPVHKDVLEALARHGKWHTEEMKKNDYTTEYIFTTASGKLYDPHNVRKALERFYKRIDVPYKETHTYRRTFCTMLCKSGVPIQTASELMGHKNISVTAKFYANISNNEKADAIDRLRW